MKHLSQIIVGAALLLLALNSCKKDPTTDNGISNIPNNCAIVLNEGGWGSNEADISIIDLDSITVVNNFFAKQNGRGLGDVAQDIAVYGNKIYIVVWGSNTIEVLDRHTGKSTQIDMGNRGPRYLAFADGKVYVSCYSPASVVRIDTSSLAIEASCPLSGLPPEGICIVGDNLYVVNTWKSDENGNYTYDSTLSIVDIATFAETNKLTVGLNPQKVKVVDNSHLAISYSGDYASHSGGIAIVDITSNSVQNITASVANIDTYDGKIYYYGNTYGQPWDGTIHIISPTTLAQRDVTISEVASFSATYYPYSINVNPSNGDIYLAGAQYGANGDIYCFSSEGSIRWKLEVGPLPSKTLFL